MNVNRLIEIDIRRCSKALYKNIRWIGMTVVFFLAIGIFIALLTQEKKDTYTTVASVYCITESGQYSETYDSTVLMMTYAEIGKSQTVLERANRMLGNRYKNISTIEKMIEIEYNPSANLETAVLKIRATGTETDELVEVANAVADSFALEMSNVMYNGNVRVLDRAKFAELETRAQKMILITIVMFMAFGFILSSAIIVLREIFSNRLYTVKDGTLYGKINIIGVIPDINEESQNNFELRY